MKVKKFLFFLLIIVFSGHSYSNELLIGNLRSLDDDSFPNFYLNHVGENTYSISYIMGEKINGYSRPLEVDLYLGIKNRGYQYSGKDPDYSIKSDQLFLLPSFNINDEHMLHLGTTQSHIHRFGSLYGHSRDMWIEFPVGVTRLASGWIDYEVCDYNLTIIINVQTKKVTLSFINTIKDLENPKIDKLNPKFRVNDLHQTSYIFEGTLIEDVNNSSK